MTAQTPLPVRTIEAQINMTFKALEGNLRLWRKEVALSRREGSSPRREVRPIITRAGETIQDLLEVLK